MSAESAMSDMLSHQLSYHYMREGGSILIVCVLFLKGLQKLYKWYIINGLILSTYNVYILVCI